jgi:hypothetical protein
LLSSGIKCAFRISIVVTTCGSLLLQNGASIVYAKEQMGQSSIQVTVDTYGHLIPGANVNFVRQARHGFGGKGRNKSATIRNSPQQGQMKVPPDLCKLRNLLAAVGLEPTTYGL